MMEHEKNIKDPYVLELPAFQANEQYLESGVDQTLIDHLRRLLLEVAREFSFLYVYFNGMRNSLGRHIWIVSPRTDSHVALSVSQSTETVSLLPSGRSMMI